MPGALERKGSLGYCRLGVVQALVHDAVELLSTLGHFSTQLPSRIRVILLARPESKL